MIVYTNFCSMFSSANYLWKKCPQGVWNSMQLLLLVQTPLCLLYSVGINFCPYFEGYDLTNGMTSTPKIWHNIPINR